MERVYRDGHVFKKYATILITPLITDGRSTDGDTDADSLVVSVTRRIGAIGIGSEVGSVDGSVIGAGAGREGAGSFIDSGRGIGAGSDRRVSAVSSVDGGIGGGAGAGGGDDW
jgi:hypothetical protein